MISASKPDEARVLPPPLQVFCENLSETLHAAAQPLTVLQASVTCGNFEAMSKRQLIDAAEGSAFEVDRLCKAFGYMQQFILTESVKPKLNPENLDVVLAEVVQGVEGLFRDAHVTLISQLPSHSQAVLIDGKRTNQALSGALLIACEMSSAHETVEVKSICLANSVRIEITNSNLHATRLKSDIGLRMRMAEANIRSQRGHFFYDKEPFCVQIELLYASEAHQS